MHTTTVQIWSILEIFSTIFSVNFSFFPHIFLWGYTAHVRQHRQVYVSLPANDAAAAVARRSACIADMNDWMKASRLRLNPSKTEVMWLGTSQQLDKIIIRNVPLLSAVVTIVNSVHNLGVTMDSQLSLDAHVAALCRSGCYQP